MRQRFLKGTAAVFAMILVLAALLTDTVLAGAGPTLAKKATVTEQDTKTLTIKKNRTTIKKGFLEVIEKNVATAA